MAELFKIYCPHCGRKHGIPFEYIGKVIRCEPCGNTIHVVVEDLPHVAAAAGSPSDSDVIGFLDEVDDDQW
ncbi:MAG: hypothetical protein GC159_06785 [Phycisphaera sp.]|nr:hypothetical protein [Phycisphaera sp.]